MFTAHKTRRLFPADLYDVPDEPHHVHVANGCTDHTVANCPDDHWVGGHPDPEYPHHVEYDGSTGQWGYMRLSDEEIADRELCEEYERETAEKIAEQVASEKAARRAVLGAKAKDDPAFRALLEELGLS